MTSDLLRLSSLILSVIVGSLTTLILAVASIAVYRVFFHPLARIPGPRLAALSNVWLARHARDGRMLGVGKRLHKIYGPMVRVGPDELWFDSKEAFRQIYSAGNGYLKSDFYLATKLNKPDGIDWHLNLLWPDTLDFLSEFDTKRYRLQRRLIGPVYQTNNVKKFETAVDGVIQDAISKLMAFDGSEVDLKEWMHIVAVECLGAVVLSWSPGYIKDASDRGTSAQSYLGWKRKTVFGLFPRVTALSFFSKSLGRWFSNAWGVTFTTPRNFKPFFTPVYRRLSKRIAAGVLQGPTAAKPPVQDRKDLLADLIQLHRDRPEFTETYLRRMAVTNFGAGHETLCSALTSILAMVGSHALVRRKVSDEVRTATSPGESISYDEAAGLRYTQACIKEAQRLYPVIAMSLARKVTESGVVMHGVYVPAGTTIGCNPVSLHRNAAIFGIDADNYSPERWLCEKDDTKLRDMERFNLTWGGGGRTCPGRHLAEMLLYKIVPALIGAFDVEVVTMPTDDDMKCYFMSMLTGVRVRFLPRDRRSSAVS